MSMINESFLSAAELKGRGWHPLSRVDANTDFIGITSEGFCVRCRKVTVTTEVMGGIITESFYIMEERYDHCVLVAAKSLGYDETAQFRKRMVQAVKLLGSFIFTKRRENAE